MLTRTKKYSTLQPFVSLVLFRHCPFSYCSDSVVFRQKTFYVTYPYGFTRQAIYEHGYSYIKAMCAQSIGSDFRELHCNVLQNHTHLDKILTVAKAVSFLHA